MTIRSELDNLKSTDIYSLMLFTLYQMHRSDEYSALSQLTFILDKENLLKLCEFYGGLTIKIPTISELEMLCNSLLLYQKVNIEHKDFDCTLDEFQLNASDKSKLVDTYLVIKEVLKNYNFNSGR